MTYETEKAQAEMAYGSDNPTLAFGLSAVDDYGTGMQYLDIMKMMRPWIGHEPDKWGGMEISDLRAGGFLDADGWVKEIPDGLQKVGTIWQWSDMLDQIDEHKGIYVLEYEGSGTLKIEGDARVLSSEPGRIVFENVTGDNLYLNLYDTDPEGTGDYIRDISIVAEKNLALYEAGATFNPDWLALIDDARELRFMDWMQTNNSTVISWDEMPSAHGPKSDLGTSVEDMVNLANELGVDPWFTMPHLADAEYIRNFATYVRDNLDPALHAKVEYSNEVWNWSFQQAQWVLQQSKDEWGVEAYVDYHAKKAVETALIWEDVFGDQADARLINVLSTQTGNPWIAERLLNPVVWQEKEPDTYVDPASVFEELAATTYFGSGTVSDQPLRDDLIKAIKDPSVDATAYLSQKLMDPDYPWSIPFVAQKLADNAAVADKYGLKLVAYEGGQHVHHSFAVQGLSDADLQVLTDFMIDFVRSDEMAQLHRDLWDTWAEVGDGPFMQFGDVGPPSKWGSWSLYNSLDDTNPRATALEELNATSTPWWDATGGEQYQQGITATGTEDDDLMIGTLQEDYLLGAGGDDLFVAGRGNDGINGGDGIDRVILSGNAQDYTLRVEGKGYRLIGPEGSDFLTNVEQISFDDDQIQVIADLPRNGDGTLQLAMATDDIPAGPVVVEDEVKTRPIKGGRGNDPLAGRIGDDLLSGNRGRDILRGGDGDDRLLGGHGRDALQGGSGQDILKGGRGNDRDVLQGDSGQDILKGGRGDDLLSGNRGRDILRGGDGDDRLLGGHGRDALQGGSGQDILKGGRGNDRDVLQGDSGQDILKGGRGDDLLTGGAGGDRFVFGDGSGHDRITDFRANDTLDLQDFLSDGQSMLDAASNSGGNLVISNGDDRITVLGLDVDDLSWMNISLV
ncbi:calcium-binding protein [Loktanella sp. DJP18]|uniref:calcium-binding protein n=1 Tax=Loktanella sp. DJP18 TaxID=3409788 RepID=UPI003BB7A526